MSTKFKGVMQSPVTPLKEDFSLDLATFEKVLDFHVRTGATAISWPHHKGESLSLTIAERKMFAEACVRVVNGRVPVTVHVSALAVEDTFALAISQGAVRKSWCTAPRHPASVYSRSIIMSDRCTTAPSWSVRGINGSIGSLDQQDLCR